MDSKRPALRLKTVRELIPYTAGSDAMIRNAAAYLRSGQNRPSQLRPRYCAAAARLAANDAAEAGDLSDNLKKVGEAQWPEPRYPSQRPVAPSPGNNSARHKQFISGFADKL